MSEENKQNKTSFEEQLLVELRNVASEIHCVHMTINTGLEWLKSHSIGLATKQDLAETERRLLTAIGGASDATLKRLTKELKGPTDSLEAAVKENQPAK